jgi:hypothetical protein
MKNLLAPCFWLVVIGLTFALVGFGCTKQASSSSQASELKFTHLPEATNVTTALDQKDYDGAINAMLKVKDSVSSEEQQNEYGALLGHVQQKVVEASASDPKAAEAMRMLRAMMVGR